ncbi:M15 family metallopeptidase [Afipia felis]|nr:M15 family metallopeptidase [Afipia felis]
MTQWPKDNQTARNAFYGDPGKRAVAPQMVPVTPPFAMYYEGRRIKTIMFHRKCASALLAALNEIWDYCQHDQAKIDAAGVSKFAGAYNRRMVRGSATKWSNHAYAAAIDLNAEENGLYAKGNMPQFVIDAFCRQGAMWGGWYTDRKDPMHFEFVDNSGREPLSPPPVFSAPVALLDVSPVGDDTPAVEFAEDHPSPSGVSSAGYSVDVELVQKKLDQLGYYEVGDVDGRWGGKTRGAIAAFMNDRCQPTDGTISPAVTAELSRAIGEGWQRPIASQRANTTAKDLAPRVEAVRQGLLQRFWARITAGFAAIGLTGSSVSGYFEAARDKLQFVRGALSHIPPEVWFLLLGAVALLAWYSARKTLQTTVRDYNTGRLN